LDFKKQTRKKTTGNLDSSLKAITVVLFNFAMVQWTSEWGFTSEQRKKVKNGRVKHGKWRNNKEE